MADNNINLLFRRGALADLSSADIIPGSISITTDEPGIYLDLANTDAGSNGEFKRVRVGDFITVQNLNELQTRANNNEIFSEFALYYSIDENMLMKYVKKEKKFILINDQSDLERRVGSLEESDVTIKASVTAVDTKVNTEIQTRADAVADLQRQIDSLAGGDGDVSLVGLKTALDNEILARERGDEALTNSLASTHSIASTNKTDIASIQALIGSLPTNVSGTIVSYFTNLITEEANTARAAEQANAKNIATNAENISKANTSISDEIARAKAAEQKNATAAANAATAAQEAAAAAAAEKVRAENAENTLNAAIGTERGRIDTLNETVSNNKTTADAKFKAIEDDIAEMDEQIQDNKTEIANHKTSVSEAIDGINDTISDLNDHVDAEILKLTQSVSDASSAAATVQTNLTKEVNRATEAEGALSDRINSLNQKIEDETAAREGDIEDLAKELSTLGTSVATNTGNLGLVTEKANKNTADIAALANLNNALTQTVNQEIARAKAAEEANAAAILAEKSRAEEAEGNLSSKITAEATNRNNAIATAKTEITQAYTLADQALLEQINENIAAANAMTFKEKAITSYTDLPATGNQAGDTYVVTAKFDNKQVGDLLIAKRDQTAADDLTTAAARRDFFIHVETGYSTYNDPKLKIGTDASNNSVIEFASHLDETLGTITVNSASENIVTTITGSGSNCAINVNFVWGTF